MTGYRFARDSDHAEEWLENPDEWLENQQWSKDHPASLADRAMGEDRNRLD